MNYHVDEQIHLASGGNVSSLLRSHRDIVPMSGERSLAHRLYTFNTVAKDT